jgi:hypothetical protein
MRSRPYQPINPASRAAIVAMLIATTGCVQMPLRPEGADAAWAWGSFCGRDYPRVEATDDQGRRAALLAIEPADDIDRACQRHDLCYIEHGMHARRCDTELTRTMYTLRFDGGQRRACARLADQIGRFFACAMPSTGEGFDAFAGALKPLTGMDPYCPGFSTMDFVNAMRAAPSPGQCTARVTAAD